MTIKVVRGNPTPEELAAALAVVRARAVAASSTPPGAPGTKDAWADPSRIAGQHLPHPSPTSWSRTYWPA